MDGAQGAWEPGARAGAGVVTVAERPDLGPLAARWLWEGFWRAYGCTLAQVEADVAGAVAPRGAPQCFVRMVDGAPVGAASLAVQDLDTRPELSPWLAGVWVQPEWRGQGHGLALIRAAEAACRAGGLPELWLYTMRAEGVYVRAGWRTVEYFAQNGLRMALMRRVLG